MHTKQNYYTIMKNYSALSEKNREQITDLSRRVFGESDAVFIGEFVSKSPFQEENKIFLALNDKTDKVVGFVNLTDIPLNYYGIEMKSCELSIVATDPAYRGLGISGKLTKMFMEEVEKCEYTSIFIQGIPYFYRKYGFNYAVPMITSPFIPMYHKRECFTNLNIRKATVDDVEAIYDLSLEFVRQHDCIYRVIRPEIIRQSIAEYQSGFLKRHYMVLENDEQIVGYFYYTKEHERYKIEEVSHVSVSRLSDEIHRGILKYMRELCKKEPFDISIPLQNSFFQFLRFIDPNYDYSKPGYSWQVKVPDYFKFFEQIRPVLEKRLKKSKFKKEEITFKFNTFDTLIAFRIKDSKIELEKLPWELTWDCNVPPQAFVKMMFDQFTYEDLKPVIPDLSIKDDFKELFKVLFPNKIHHLNQGY